MIIKNITGSDCNLTVKGAYDEADLFLKEREKQHEGM
jgi:hypothetical protein